MKEDLHYLSENVKKVMEEWSVQDTRINRSSLLKRFIRKLTYWLYKPMWDQQIEFNKNAAAAIADIYRLHSAIVSYIEEGILPETEPLILPEDGKPRILQLVSSLNYGDAVGNEVIAFKKALQEQGYTTEIFAQTIHRKISPNTAVSYKRMPQLNKEDIVIYHFSSQCGMFEMVKKLPCKVILRYHNITPPSFFKGYDAEAEAATRVGLAQVKELRNYVDYCLPVSEFNRSDLIEKGYCCPMAVLPILINFDDYAQPPSKKVIEKYSDGRKNILFVGRMAPNKKIEDVIRCFAEYKKHYDGSARLFLVGSFQENDKYYKMLVKHIGHLGVKDILFPGHIPFDEILAYYKIADLFLCMSEHEGFCVPLVEAMYFNVPIIAYDSSAVASTIGGSGIVVKDKNYQEICRSMNQILEQEEEKQFLIEQERQRLDAFDNKKILNGLQKFLKEVEEDTDENLSKK